MILEVGHRGHLGRYCYILLIALSCLGSRGKILYFGEIGNPGDQLLRFLKFFGSGGGNVCAGVGPCR